MKLHAAVLAALLFYVMSNPITYKLVEKTITAFPLAQNGKPTGTGLLVQSLVFGVITYILMCL
jgi:hypothetical protein